MLQLRGRARGGARRGFNPVTKGMYEAFQASLVLRLGLCRVTAEVSPAALPATTGTEGARLELADAGSQASVWSARSSFKFSSSQQDDEIAGIGFARGVVDQLHRDGLLARCIAEPYLGCVADRREARQRADRIRDDRERFIAMHNLPECK